MRNECPVSTIIEYFLFVWFFFVARLPEGLSALNSKNIGVKNMLFYRYFFFLYFHLHIISKPLEAKITVFPSMGLKKQIMFCVSLFFKIMQTYLHSWENWIFGIKEPVIID